MSQQSEDALETLCDLSRAVTDGTGKLADATRSLAAATTTSAIGNAGLIIGRLTLPKEACFVGPAAIMIGVALAIYVAAVIANGWHFLLIQHDLHDDRRERLCRFLPEDEYGIAPAAEGALKGGQLPGQWSHLNDRRSLRTYDVLGAGLRPLPM